MVYFSTSPDIRDPAYLSGVLWGPFGDPCTTKCTLFTNGKAKTVTVTFKQKKNGNPHYVMKVGEYVFVWLASQEKPRGLYNEKDLKYFEENALALKEELRVIKTLGKRKR